VETYHAQQARTVPNFGQTSTQDRRHPVPVTDGSERTARHHLDAQQVELAFQLKLSALMTDQPAVAEQSEAPRQSWRCLSSRAPVTVQSVDDTHPQYADHTRQGCLATDFTCSNAGRRGTLGAPSDLLARSCGGAGFNGAETASRRA
jgi:hypothetical protein